MRPWPTLVTRSFGELLRALVLLAALLAPLPASAQPGVTDDDEATELALAELPGAPPIRDVVRAAYAAAGLDRPLGKGFTRRARIAGLVPWLSVRAGHDTSWKELEPEVGRGTTLEIRATWRLDRLVFDPRELQVVSLEAARRRERMHLAKVVIKTYFTWRRAALAAGPARFSERSEEAAAELDALTDGWFSERISDLRRTASETRTFRTRAATP